MSASRVREIRTHGLKGGRWRRGPDPAEKGEKAEAQHPTPGTTDQPAAYLTARRVVSAGEVLLECVELRLVPHFMPKAAILAFGADLGDRDVESHDGRVAVNGQGEVVRAVDRRGRLFALVHDRAL
jgi:hypothetical protein